MRATLGVVAVVALLAACEVERVNVTESGAQTDGFGVEEPAVIDDTGNVVVFSTPDYLTGEDVEGVSDIYARVRSSGQTVLASVTDDGRQDTGGMRNPAVSGDGRYVAFTSSSDGFLPPPPDALGTNLFVKDRRTGLLERIVIPADGVNDGYSTGDAADFDQDGSHLLFSWGYPGGVPTVFVLDRTTGQLEAAGVSQAGDPVRVFSGSISDDGRKVVFAAQPKDMIPGSTINRRQVFVRDLDAGTTKRVSTTASGAFLADRQWRGEISGDGRSAVITQEQPPHHVFRKDLVTGALTQVDVAGCASAAPSGLYPNPSISRDGTRIAFASDAALVPSDDNGVGDVYLWWADRPCRVRLISMSVDGVIGDGESEWPDISGDGRHVVYASLATNLVPGDTNETRDAFVWSDDTA